MRLPLASIAFLFIVGCSPAVPQQQAPACAAAPIVFELAVPPDRAFQQTLTAFVHFGLAVTEASASEDYVRAAPYSFGEATLTYSADVRKVGSNSRIILAGLVDAPKIGLANAPIVRADHGVRARYWQNMTRLARAIETSTVVITMPPSERTDRKSPE
ncbi:MAG: hypothetical protein ACREON_18780 [Gemmatimonadaceae bacterium]